MLQIELAASGSVNLGWASITGRIYQLQSITNLPTNAAPSPPISWSDEGSPFAGTGGMLTTNIPIAPAPAKFFRVQVPD